MTPGAREWPSATDRSGSRWWAAPAGVAALAAAGAALLYLRDPHRTGAYGHCPFHALTGLWCPGCGGLRAIADLLHADVAASLSSNAFVLPLTVVLVAAWMRWLVRRSRGGGGRMIVLGPAASVFVPASLVVFTIVRNTPWGSALAPG